MARSFLTDIIENWRFDHDIRDDKNRQGGACPHVIAFCQQVPRDHVGLNLHVTSEDIKKLRIAKYR